MSTVNCNSELLHALAAGATKLSDSVGSTLGPGGCNVLIKNGDKPIFLTKDGVTVANNLQLEDRFENMAAEVIKQSSRRTNIEAGDGTTTSTVLASAIFRKSVEMVNSRSQAVGVYRSMERLGSTLLGELNSVSTEVESLEQIKHIATVSANNDISIGELVTMAVDSVGHSGSITIEDSNTSDTILDLVEGFRFSSGFCSSTFITDERKRLMVYEKPLFLITDEKLETVDQILPSLELAARESRPLIFVCEEIEGQALAALIMNKTRGTLKVSAIKAPSYGEDRRNVMSDLAMATGAKFFNRLNGDNLSNVKLTDFGSAASIRSSNTDTVITGVEGDHELVQQRIQDLTEQIQSTEQSAAEIIVERLNRLQSGVGVIRVGGNSQVEVIEKRHRIEDALEAVKSAQEEGVVPGGSWMLMYARNLLRSGRGSLVSENEKIASDILEQSLSAPLETMLSNSGLSIDIEEVYTFEDSINQFGINLLTGEITNLYEAGIIDPFKVVRCCVKNAISTAGNLLTTNYAILNPEN